MVVTQVPHLLRYGRISAFDSEIGGKQRPKHTEYGTDYRRTNSQKHPGNEIFDITPWTIELDACQLLGIRDHN